MITENILFAVDLPHGGLQKQMNEEERTQKKQKITVYIVIVIFILLFIGLALLVGIPVVQYASEPDKFRKVTDKLGSVSKLIYIGLSALQVIIAFIPGEPVELLGGYAFGTIEGMLLNLIGAFAGSMAVFGLVRKFGKRAVEIFFSNKKMDSIKFLQTSTKKNLLFAVIFAIPGTPKDLLSYYAGLTDIKLGTWILICTLGRLPSVIISTISGNALGSKQYTFAIIVTLVTIAVSSVGLITYKIICSHNSKQEKNKK